MRDIGAHFSETVCHDLYIKCSHGNAAVGVGPVLAVLDRRAACTAGNSSAIRIPMIVMTTRSSTNVNAFCRFVFMCVRLQD
jgi:hypothetical protein